MPIVACIQCRKDFYIKPAYIKRGAGKHCSRACRQKTEGGRIVQCHWCGKDVYRIPKHLKKHKHFFCTKKCSLLWQNTVFVQEKHPNWKNGHSSYRLFLEKSPRLVVCERCGESNKIVLTAHHLDMDRTNNTLKNLAWLCRNCHFLIHHYEGERENYYASRIS